MSLVGNLEDLGLGDILQIVSLSRKSGVLKLYSQGREGSVVFVHGQVIQATGSGHKENLGHLLLQRKLIDLATLQRALTLQRNTPKPPRIGKILTDRFGLSSEKIEAAVRDYVEKIVYSFFAWENGTFAFELGDPQEAGLSELNPLELLLAKGLNTQWLAMEGSRRLDEHRQLGTPLESAVDPVPELDDLLGGLARELPPEASAEAAKQLGEPQPDGGIDTLWLVDDDETSRDCIRTALVEARFKVQVYPSAELLLADLPGAEIDRLGFVIDLLMPRMDGSGLLGGLELASRLRQYVDPGRLLLLTDYPNSEADQELQAKGIALPLRKPRKDQLRKSESAGLLTKLVHSIDRFFTAPAAGENESGDFQDFSGDLLREVGLAASRPEPESDSLTPGLNLLKGMLEELHNPVLGGGITLLVLRFAAGLMNRSVLFMVKKKMIVSLGQFGLEALAVGGGSGCPEICIPRHELSPFSAALAQKQPRRIKLGNGEWDRYLQSKLGGDRPMEAYVGPLLSEGKVVALLYGDNLPEQKMVGETMALDIFLSQAGMAMEKALLERRLRSHDVI